MLTKLSLVNTWLRSVARGHPVTPRYFEATIHSQTDHVRTSGRPEMKVVNSGTGFLSLAFVLYFRALGKNSEKRSLRDVTACHIPEKTSSTYEASAQLRHLQESACRRHAVVALTVKSPQIITDTNDRNRQEEALIDVGYLRLAKYCFQACGHASTMSDLLHRAIIVSMDVETVWVVARRSISKSSRRLC